MSEGLGWCSGCSDTGTEEVAKPQPVWMCGYLSCVEGTRPATFFMGSTALPVSLSLLKGSSRCPSSSSRPAVPADNIQVGPSQGQNVTVHVPEGLAVSIQTEKQAHH
jgi:hypothetical protein